MQAGGHRFDPGTLHSETRLGPFGLILQTAAAEAADEPFGQRASAIIDRLPGGIGHWEELEAAADELEPSPEGRSQSESDSE